MQDNQQALDFFHSLITELPFGIITINSEGLVTLMNTNSLLFLGLEGSTDMYEETNILSFDISRKLKNRIKSCLFVEKNPFHLKALSIKNRFLNVYAKRLLDGLVINIIDVTENIQMRDQATQSLLFGQESERKRLAKEMHDGIGPALSLIRLQVDAVNRKIDTEDITQQLNNIIELISNVALDIRQISHALMPGSLIDFGVVSALNNLVKQLNDSESFDVFFDTNMKDNSLPKNLELNIYRIIQELLNNAIKYSNCTEIQIQLHQLNHAIQLSVYDNGVGMDIEKSREGIGINNIHTRVKSFRGVFEIDSQPGHGVNANISIPIKK
jgi:signal transduction histidine kinase